MKSKWYFSRILQPNTPLSVFDLEQCLFTYKWGRIVPGLQFQQNTTLIWPVLEIPSKMGIPGPVVTLHLCLIEEEKRQKRWGNKF